MIPLAAGMLAGSVPWRAVGVAVLLTGTFAAGWAVNGWRLGRQIEAEHAAAAQQQAAQQAEARRFEQQRAAKVQEVQDAYAARARHDRATADAARTELDGLRADLAARDRIAQAPGATCRVDAGAVERKLLGECAAALQGLAVEADAVEGQLRSLQDWARAVSAAAGQP